MSGLVYAWKPYASPGGISAQTAGEELTRIRAERGEFFTPRAVVEASVDQDAPLHPAFEWDDEKAAVEHRETQARNLIRGIVVVNASDEARSTVSAFVSVHQEDKTSGYTTIAHAMSEEKLREQVLAQAASDMKAFERRYREFLDLSKMIKEFRRAHLRAVKVPELHASA